MIDFIFIILGVVNSISQACGKLSFNIGNYLHTQKEGKKNSHYWMYFIWNFHLAITLNAVFPYHDLRNLSRLFKDNLANRLLCKLLEGKIFLSLKEFF